MKTNTWIRATFLAAGILLNTGIAFAQPEIFSNLTIDKARQAAARENKILIIDFGAVWCPPCKAMDQVTWVDPAVTAWIKKNAIALQIDVDKERDVAVEMDVSAYPTVLVFKPRNISKEADRKIGFQSPSILLKWLNSKVPAPAKTK
jgi:thiol:disulfide interchange protein